MSSSEANFGRTSETKSGQRLFVLPLPLVMMTSQTRSSLSEYPPLPPSTPSLEATEVHHEGGDELTVIGSIEMQRLEEIVEHPREGGSTSASTKAHSVRSPVFEQSLPPVDGGRDAWSFVSSHI